MHHRGSTKSPLCKVRICKLANIGNLTRWSRINSAFGSALRHNNFKRSLFLNDRPRLPDCNLTDRIFQFKFYSDRNCTIPLSEVYTVTVLIYVVRCRQRFPNFPTSSKIPKKIFWQYESETFKSWHGVLGIGTLLINYSSIAVVKSGCSLC